MSLSKTSIKYSLVISVVFTTHHQTFYFTRNDKPTLSQIEGILRGTLNVTSIKDICEKLWNNEGQVIYLTGPSNLFKANIGLFKVYCC